MIVSDGVLEGLKWFWILVAAVLTIVMRAMPRAKYPQSLGVGAFAVVAWFSRLVRGRSVGRS